MQGLLQFLIPVSELCLGSLAACCCSLTWIDSCERTSGSYGCTADGLWVRLACNVCRVAGRDLCLVRCVVCCDACRLFWGQQPRLCPRFVWDQPGSCRALGNGWPQPYLGKFAALMAAMMGAAMCLAALLAAKKLAAIPGRLVSGLRLKFLAGNAKEKLLSGWIPCSPWVRVMLQIPQVGRCRATESLATESSVPVFLCANKEGSITAAHAMDLLREYITECLPVRMSLDGSSSKKRNPAFSAVFEERSKDTSIGGGTWYEAATCCCCLCE